MLSEFRPLAMSVANRYYLPGSDRADIEQEAMIGLLGAIRAYRPNGGRGFTSFAYICIERQVMTAVKNATRNKHRVLTESARSTVTHEGDQLDVFELAEAPGADPADIVEAREQLRAVVAALPSLTELERHWLARALNDEPYTGGKGRRNKRAENAIGRAREKLRKVA